MVFNSYIFILAFLPLVVSGYFFVNKVRNKRCGQAGLVWLLFTSFVFFSYDDPEFLVLLLASIGVNYTLGMLMTRDKNSCAQRRNLQKAMLILGILLNLAPLLYCKYSNFFLNSLEKYFEADWEVDVGLPLGISFFTFMQIAYLVDCYREEKGFDYSIIEYATYVAFFPKITMGPIVLHSEVMPQLRDDTKKTVNYSNLSQGLYVFVLGLAKKVLIADVLAKFVSVGFGEVGELNSATAIMVMVSYTLQIYFDFSGYCDMAIGVSKMLNIDLPYNFNSPYKAKSISEFWDRWHMTLTRFFTRYVYIPMGGSRKGKIRTYLNTLLVFLLSGLWHGANWTFVLWGLLHGIIMVLEKIVDDIGLGYKAAKGMFGKVIACVRWGVTFAVINITWIFFRAESVDMAVLYLKQIFSGGWRLVEDVIDVFDKLIEIRMVKRLGLASVLDNHVNIAIWSILALLVMSTVFMRNAQEKINDSKYNVVRSVLTTILLVWSIISLSDVSEFLYFNF